MNDGIVTGVIMRIGTYDIADYPGRTQREVHPSRRDESITYKIEKGTPFKRTSKDEREWEHYSYKFTYRYLGRTLTVDWKCGILYGEPKPQDGLAAAFSDASTVAWDAFGADWMNEWGFDYETDYQEAKKIYNACSRMNERLDRFFGEERGTWQEVFEEIS